jgi:ABC-type sugar transport system permease subunit
VPERRRTSWRDALTAYGFLAPALLFLVALLGWPILDTAWLSLTKFNFVYDDAPRFVGLANYAALFASSGFRNAFFNTLVFTALFMPLFLGISLAAALAVNAVPRFGDLFRTLIFLPIIVGESVAGVIFTWMFSRDFGLMNQALGAVGLGAWERSWVADPSTALAVIIVVQLWLLGGVGMLIFLSGLRAIPAELYDAAAVDGAKPVQTFYLVTLPNLRVHAVLATVWGLVQAIKIFGVPYVMTHGGPAGATETLYLYVWRSAFRQFDIGQAAAVGYVIALLILAFATVSYAVGRRGEST